MITYEKMIYEYCDVNDSTGFVKLMSLNEADQSRVMANLAGKLYNHIVNEITDIDFGDIPKSKGDITKIPNYIDMVDCINIIHNVCIRCKQKTTATDTLFKAIDNLKESKDIWRRSFDLKVSLGINTYNSLALSIVCATSLLISTSIEFIKDQNSGEFEIIMDKVQHQKSMNSVLFKSLQEFNKGYANGEFMQAINIANNSKRNISEAELMSFDESAMMDALLAGARKALDSCNGGGVIGGLAKGATTIISVIGGIALIAAIVIPAIRNAVHFFYSSKQKLSDYFAIQAALIEMNANNLKYNTSKSEQERERIYNAQMKWVDKFKKLSTTLSAKMKKADNESKNKLEEETSSKKFTYDDVSSDGDVSSLF